MALVLREGTMVRITCAGEDFNGRTGTIERIVSSAQSRERGPCWQIVFDCPEPGDPISLHLFEDEFEPING